MAERVDHDQGLFCLDPLFQPAHSGTLMIGVVAVDSVAVDSVVVGSATAAVSSDGRVPKLGD